ncbi:hypothetical protein EEZ25_09445 [Micromonospora aurantiaca]|uniref:Uncharacterized protein n=1 Tax=Micromonospora aurantiaca (nom. illeg.) TaxID=47850 RepID=A0A3M9KTI8_9ACTN|nr:hypothetical protein [Micromonospora aurantiaca]AXH90290.1 hypothetical protein DVH21_10340 [Micromonospora aurantiaca]RNI04341.1 hypothetical protein EEZ25_09445 [Micromonospora aurantiaca]
MTTEPPRRRLVPAIALLLLAPWTAECSWGGFTLTGMPFVVLVLAPMYGGAALLIRETARRFGLGWPGIALLAAAFGVIQAGLVDQSLFNPGFLDDTEFADTRAAAEATLVPGLGFSARQAVDYVGNHVVLTVCAPIALVESYLGAGRRARPWLGRPGLTAAALLWLGGSLLVFADDGGRKNFLASPVQLAVATGVALALITAALLRHRHAGPPPDAPTPAGPTPAGRPQTEAGPPRPLRPALVVAVGYVGSTIAPGWPGVVLALALAGIAAALLTRWSRRPGWGQRHVLATGSAGLVVAAALAYTVPTYAPASPVAALVGDVAISVIVLLLVGGAWWRVTAVRDRRRAAAPAGRPASPPA